MTSFTLLLPNDFENPPEYNPDEFSSWWNVWLFHLVLLVTIKLETQGQRVYQST